MGGREDERAVSEVIAGSMRRMEGGRTTLSVANEVTRTWIPGSEVNGGLDGTEIGLTNNSSIKEAEKYKRGVDHPGIDSELGFA